MLEPRRVAVRAAARRMANEDGSELGRTFGYHVRFDRKAGPNTPVVVQTPGVLLRELQADPFLEGISCVVFDEFHERGIDADLAFALVRLVRATVRPDLQVVVMSATLDAGPISEYLGGAPVVTSEGRSYPVQIQYRSKRKEQRLPEAVADAVEAVLLETPGDVLAFLPGVGEIRRCQSLLEHLPDVEVLMLHGELPPEQQDRALRKLDRRKVVLATNVAETSVTVDGVTAVVDGGMARQLEFDAGVGMDRLRLAPISRASAEQRAGRAGRTQPGVCVRLWDEHTHRARAEHTEPEIRRADVAGAVLHLLSSGENPTRFAWFDPPRPEAVAHALELLRLLGALTDTALTPLGAKLAELPVHPRVGRLLLEGAMLGVASQAATAAALLSDRDPFVREDRPPPVIPTESDLLDRVEAVEEWEATGRTRFAIGELHPGGVRQVMDVKRQLLRLIGEPGPQGPRVQAASTHAPAALAGRVHQAVLAAYPDRLARRRGPSDRRGLMVSGRGVVLGPRSGVLEPDLFVCIDVDAGGVESVVRLASGVRKEWLPPDQLVTTSEVIFDATAEKVTARKRTRFADLILDDTPAHIADETEAAAVLATACVRLWPKPAPPPDSPAGAFLLRVRWLTEMLPDADLPPVDDDALKALLPDVCHKLRSVEAVKAGPWLDHIRAAFSYKQLQLIENEAPERFEVPTGSQIELQYEPGRPPVLAVRIQEVFGLDDTPRIAGGRVKVLLHLLAPNYRPQQVTDDLASFWANGYPRVRGELRARYPRHSWPDDPATADPIRGPKKRGG